jgi:nucleotide-binding universal stress UspA family protein
MYNVTSILFPADFSEGSREAFSVALQMARANHARLQLLHVVDPRIQAGELAAVLPITEPALDQILKQLHEFEVGAPGIEVERHVRQGDVTDEILRFARDHHCDLIVMATHGRKGLGRILLGSVAENVLRRSPCPVLTVRGHLEVSVEEPAETLAAAPG